MKVLLSLLLACAGVRAHTLAERFERGTRHEDPLNNPHQRKAINQLVTWVHQTLKGRGVAVGKSSLGAPGTRDGVQVKYSRVHGDRTRLTVYHHRAADGRICVFAASVADSFSWFDAFEFGHLTTDQDECADEFADEAFADAAVSR